MMTTQKSKRRKRAQVTVLVVGLLGLTSLAARPIRENYFEISKQLEILNALFRELNIYYVDELQPGEIMETGIKAMVHSLDPYTVYYPESQVEDLRFMTTGEYGGVGATVQQMGGKTTLVDVFPDFPAAKAGMRIGDVLLKVEGEPLDGLDVDQISERLQGATGSEVDIEYLPLGSSTPASLTLTREKIKMPAVPYSAVVGDSTAYVVLTSFTRNCAGEVRQAIKALQDSVGIHSVILDLRGNGGGLLNEAVTVVNQFIPKGEEVVRTRGKVKDWEKVYTTLGKPILEDGPVIVLVDGYSASASEIVAGTLQDLDRAVVVGQESFGKGLVQQNKDLAYGTKLKVTVAKYYTPSGRCIQRLNYSRDGAEAIADSLLETFYTRNGRPVRDGKGIQPDVEIEPMYYGHVLDGLFASGTIFRFVNEFVGQNDSIGPAAGFRLSEEVWSDFVSFAVSDTALHYPSATSSAFEEAMAMAREERYWVLDSAAFLQIERILTPEVTRDLAAFREEIQEALEEEIVMRYHLQPGVIEWMLPRDPAVDKALEVIRTGAHESILAGPTEAKRK
jgi:carboxyl-terminal processing protease